MVTKKKKVVKKISKINNINKEQLTIAKEIIKNVSSDLLDRLKVQIRRGQDLNALKKDAYYIFFHGKGGGHTKCGNGFNVDIFENIIHKEYLRITQPKPDMDKILDTMKVFIKDMFEEEEKHTKHCCHMK